MSLDVMVDVVLGVNFWLYGCEAYFMSIESYLLYLNLSNCMCWGKEEQIKFHLCYVLVGWLGVNHLTFLASMSSFEK